jgi:hypothetical protein
MIDEVTDRLNQLDNAAEHSVADDATRDLADPPFDPVQPPAVSCIDFRMISASKAARHVGVWPLTEHLFSMSASREPASLFRQIRADVNLTE